MLYFTDVVSTLIRFYGVLFIFFVWISLQFEIPEQIFTWWRHQMETFSALSVTQRNCLYLWRKRGPVQASVCGRKRAQTSAEFNHVELSRPA